MSREKKTEEGYWSLLIDPELDEKLNAENMKLRSMYLDFMKESGNTPQTIAAYGRDLMIAFNYIYLMLENKSVVSLSKHEVEKFQAWMADRGVSEYRVKNIRTAILSLSSYIKRELKDMPEYKNYKPEISKSKGVTYYFRRKNIISEKERKYRRENARATVGVDEINAKYRGYIRKEEKDD